MQRLLPYFDKNVKLTEDVTLLDNGIRFIADIGKRFKQNILRVTFGEY